MAAVAIGSFVVDRAGGGFVMQVCGLDGDLVYCVSVDRQRSIKGWRHKSTLKPYVRRAIRFTFG